MKMKISRTNMPTLSSVIVSLEKKNNGKKQQKTPHTDECYSNYAKSCSLLFTPTPFSSLLSCFLAPPSVPLCSFCSLHLTSACLFLDIFFC